MRWKAKQRPECYPGVEAGSKPQERLVRLLLLAMIAILSVFSLIYVSRARAHGIHPSGLDYLYLNVEAWAPKGSLIHSGRLPETFSTQK